MHAPIALILGLFLRIPPQLRGAGATGALWTAAAAAHTAGYPEVAALFVAAWALGFVCDLWVLPILKERLRRDDNHDGVPDALAGIPLPPGVTWQDVRLLLGHVSRVGLERALEAVMRLPSRPTTPPSLKNTTAGLLVLLALAPAHSGCAAASALCARGIALDRFDAHVAGGDDVDAATEVAQSTVDLDVCGLPIIVETYVTTREATVCVVAPLLGTRCETRGL